MSIATEASSVAVMRVCPPSHLARVILLAATLSGVAHGGSLPDYFFNGPVTYDASSGTLSISTGVGGAEIFSSTGLPAPYAVIPTTQPGSNIPGSEIVLSMSLVPGSVSDNGLVTTASFATAPGFQAALYLGNGSGGTAATPVLTGTLSGLQVGGLDGNNFGELTGYLHPTGGLAYAYFSNPSDVIALNFDLSTTFGGSMFGSSFAGQINGQVESTTAPVPLPASVALLGPALGLLAWGGVRRRRATLV